MGKTLTKVWVHLIWTTKKRAPFLVRSIRYDLFKYLNKYCEKNDIHLDIINGMEDHVHVLVRLQPTQSLASVINKIKGASSRWINLNTELDGTFKWQDGYGALSVSPDNIHRVRKYIYNQEKHHLNKTLDNEIREMESQSTNNAKP